LEELNPSSLLSSHLLQFVEILKVFVIGEDLDRVLHTQEEGASTFKRKDNAGEFLVIDIVVLFSREEAMRVEGNWMYAVLVFLYNDHTKGIARCISVHNEWLRPVGGFQDGFTSADVF